MLAPLAGCGDMAGERPRARVYPVFHAALRDSGRQRLIPLGMFGMRPAGYSRASQKLSHHAPFVVTTGVSAWRRFQRWTGSQTPLILDECHHVNFWLQLTQTSLISLNLDSDYPLRPGPRLPVYFNESTNTPINCQAIADGKCRRICDQ